MTNVMRELLKAAKGALVDLESLNEESQNTLSWRGIWEKPSYRVMEQLFDAIAEVEEEERK